MNAHRFNFALLALFVLAFVLRVIAPETAIFHFDNAFPTAQAIGFLSGADLTILGSPSDSFLRQHPAGLAYLVLPVWALTRSPQAVAVFIGTLNAFAVVFVALTALRLPRMTRLGALAAAGLVAVSPFVVEYSRMTWTSALVPLMVALVAWLLFPVWLGQAGRPFIRTLAAWLCLAALAMTTQLALIPIASAGLLSLIFWRRTSWPATIAGGLVFCVTFGLFILELPGSVFSRTTGTVSSFGLNPLALVNALRSFSGLGYEPDGIINLPDTFSAPAAPDVVSLAVLAAAGVGFLFALRQRETRPALTLVIVWLLVPVMTLAVLAPSAHVYYLLLALPSGFLLFGWGISVLRDRLPVAFAVIALVCGGIIFSARNIQHLAWLDARPAQSDLWQASMRDALAVADVIRPALSPETVIQSEMFDPAVKASLGQDVRVIWDMIDPRITVFPSGGLLYFQAVGADETAKRLVGSENVADVVLPSGTRLHVSQVDREAAAFSTLQPLDMPTQQGLSLVGIDVRTLNSGDMRLRMAWRVEGVSPALDGVSFGSFAHGFDSSGERIQIIDGPTMETLWWTAGDIHLHSVIFTPDSRLASLRVRQYDAANQSALRFMDSVDSVIVWP